jgi:hypothetical protein
MFDFFETIVSGFPFSYSFLICSLWVQHLFYWKWEIILRDDRQLVQCHRAKRWESKNVNPDLSNPSSFSPATSSALFCPWKPPWLHGQTHPHMGSTSSLQVQVADYRSMVMETSNSSTSWTLQNLMVPGLLSPDKVGVILKWSTRRKTSDECLQSVLAETSEPPG